MIIETDQQMEQLGRQLGRQLRGGEVIELIGDVGAGKTTLVRGLAAGLDITDNIVSPSFTINCNYPARDGLTLHHYDFYRLADAGIVSLELGEAINDPVAVTVIEWGSSIQDVLPANHIVIRIDYRPETGRQVKLDIPDKFNYLKLINAQ